MTFCQDWATIEGMKFADEIRAHLGRRGLTHDQLAAEYKVSRVTVAAWCKGDIVMSAKVAKLANEIATSDQQFREFILEAAGIDRGDESR